MSRDVIQPARLRDAARDLARDQLGSELAARLGWPRLERAPTPRAAGVGVHLSQVDVGDVWWHLDTGLALAIAERAIGGEELPPVAAPGEPVPDAQLGVLAYVLARWLAESGSQQCVRQVGAPMPEIAPAVRWEMDVQFGTGMGRAELLCAETAARAMRLPVELELSRGPLEERPAAGDVVVPDAMNLSGAPGNWGARGQLEVPGLVSSSCPVVLHRRRIERDPADGPAGAEDEAGARVVLPLGELSLWDLARLADEPVQVSGATQQPVLRHGTETIATEAVTLDGSPALRVAH